MEKSWLKALSYILSFHQVLSAMVMSPDVIQVGVHSSVLFNIFNCNEGSEVSRLDNITNKHMAYVFLL